MANTGYMPTVRRESSAALVAAAAGFAASVASTVLLTALFGVWTGHIGPEQAEKMTEISTENPLMKFLAALSPEQRAQFADLARQRPLA